MTDLEKVVELYKGFGIELKPVRSEHCITIAMARDDKTMRLEGTIGSSYKIVFMLNGSFHHHALWD